MRSRSSSDRWRRTRTRRRACAPKSAAWKKGALCWGRRKSGFYFARGRLSVSTVALCFCRAPRSKREQQKLLADIEAQRKTQAQALRTLERLQGNGRNTRREYDSRLNTLNSQVRKGVARVCVGGVQGGGRRKRKEKEGVCAKGGRRTDAQHHTHLNFWTRMQVRKLDSDLRTERFERETSALYGGAASPSRNATLNTSALGSQPLNSTLYVLSPSANVLSCCVSEPDRAHFPPLFPSCTRPTLTGMAMTVGRFPLLV